MKYETITKTSRNQEVVDLHKNRPELSLQEIGNRFGITRARVSQIIIKAKKKA